MTGSETFRPGLEGVVAAQTALSSVDGAAGRLVIAGYEVGELAPKATFEETVFLLWNGRRPDTSELATLREELAAARELPIAAVNSPSPIDGLRMSLCLLAPTGDDREDAFRVVGLLPVLAASAYRRSRNLPSIAPHKDLGHVANYLYMLDGETPHPERVRAVETYFNVAVDHGLNASTFVARCIASTESDMVSSLVGALGALKGPLHGGAPGPALEMVFEIGSPDRAEAEIRARLQRGERLMGFGHRIYKVRDPRADVLKDAAERMFAHTGDCSLYDLAMAVEGTALRLLEEYKPGRNLRTNVEFYTALVLQGAGIPVEMFTPTFALARAVGWSAHVMEQRKTNRIFRPASIYVGQNGLKWERHPV